MMHRCSFDRGECPETPHETSPGGVVLALRDVDYRYPNGTLALQGVGLTVERFSNVAVIGPNGGGKTTLLKLLLGILKPSSGDMSVMGAAPHRACVHLGYVPQHTSIQPEFPVTVKEVVTMGCGGSHFLGWHGRGCKACVAAILDEMEIRSLQNRAFGKLSGGERQRVLIARALVGHPDILLLDEPLANVDPALQSKFRKTILSLSERMTVITVSHDLSYLTDEIDQVVFVNRGAKTYRADEIRSLNLMDLYRGGRLVESVDA